jgi:hypothetical protein
MQVLPSNQSNANAELIRQHRKQLEKRVGVALAQDSALDIALLAAFHLDKSIMLCYTLSILELWWNDRSGYISFLRSFPHNLGKCSKVVQGE